MATRRTHSSGSARSRAGAEGVDAEDIEHVGLGSRYAIGRMKKGKDDDREHDAGRHREQEARRVHEEVRLADAKHGGATR